MSDFELPFELPLASRLGLFDRRAFRVTTGRCGDCAAIPAALWYFREETIAAPLTGLQVAGFARGVRLADDLRQWAATRSADAAIEFPPLILDRCSRGPQRRAPVQ